MFIYIIQAFNDNFQIVHIWEVCGLYPIALAITSADVSVCRCQGFTPPLVCITDIGKYFGKISVENVVNKCTIF
jgi:hypothetical protein